MTDRDLQLCEALNAGYLLRLSLAPDLKNLDKTMRKEFMGDDSPGASLLSGKVVMFRRGYGTEITEDRRLIIPKLDYLQASLVQRNAAVVSDKLADIQVRIGGRKKVTIVAQRTQQQHSHCLPVAGQGGRLRHG